MSTALSTSDSPIGKAIPGARVALALLLAINLFNYIDRYVLAAMLPKIEVDPAISPPGDPITKEQLGRLAPAFVWSYMLLTPLFGWLGDRKSRWALVGVGVILWSLASGGSGLAIGYLMLLLTRCCVGVGEAAYGPAAPTLISDLFPVSKRGLVMAWFYMAIPVGSAIGYLYGAVIADTSLGWRWAFYLLVPPGVILGVLCFFMREPPVGQADAVVMERPKGFKDYLGLLRIRSYVINTAAATAWCFAVGGISYWMPYYIYERESRFEWTERTHVQACEGIGAVTPEVADKLDVSLLGRRFDKWKDFGDAAQGVLSKEEWQASIQTLMKKCPTEESPSLTSIGTMFGGIIALGGIIATLFGGYLGDRLRPRYSGSYFLVSGWGALIGLPFFLLVLVTPFPWAWGFLFVSILAIFLNTGPSNTILANVVPANIRSSAFALNILIIHALGDAVSPWIIGAVADAYTLAAGLQLVSVMIVASGVIWLLGGKYLEADTKAALGQSPKKAETLIFE